jgi:hypothetical protein
MPLSNEPGNRTLVFVERDEPAWPVLWKYFDSKHILLYGKSDRRDLDPSTGETWQYMGTVLLEEGIEHQFRHRHHPRAQRRLYLAVKLDYATAMMAKPATA